MYFMGIDIGTSSVKIIVMDEDGNIKADISKTYLIFYPKPGWAEQNPDDWWERTKSGIREVLSKTDISSDEIKAIGVTGQMHGLVLLDSENVILRPAILWNDQRTEHECEYITDCVGKERLSELTGNKAITGFTAPKILWVRNNEMEIYRKIKHILLPKDFVKYKLTGEFSTDVSDASGTLLFDVKDRKWSKDMLEILDIPESWLPHAYESMEIAGYVTKEAAEETGLKTGTLVVAGGGDQACGAVGTGTVEEGIISVSLGTSGVVFACQDGYSVDEMNRLHTFCHANGKWHVMGVMLSAASCLKWWVENNEPHTFEDLIGEAEKVEAGSDGLIFLPYLMGERTPYSDPYAKGCFMGLNMIHGRGHLTRAIMEGVAFGLMDSMEIIRSLDIPIREVRLSGGGSNSKLWRQIIADVFETDVSVLSSSEGPSYGAAILSAVGYGFYDTVEEGCKRTINISETVSPCDENVNIYNKIYNIYKGMYAKLKDTFYEISNLC